MSGLPPNDSRKQKPTISSRVLKIFLITLVAFSLFSTVLVFKIAPEILLPSIRVAGESHNATILVALRDQLLAGDWYNLAKNLNHLNQSYEKSGESFILHQSGTKMFPEKLTAWNLQNMPRTIIYDCAYRTKNCPSGYVRTKDLSLSADYPDAILFVELFNPFNRPFNRPLQVNPALQEENFHIIGTLIHTHQFQKPLNTLIIILISVTVGLLLLIGIVLFINIRTLISKPISMLSNNITKEPIAISQLSIPDKKFETREIFDIRTAIVGFLGKIKQQEQEKLAGEVDRRKAEKLAAIGQTTSMIAHDIRKPFSQLKSILGSFDLIRDDHHARDKAKQDVLTTIRRVESMLADIMDYSRDMKLETTPCSILPLIDSSIKEVIRNYQGRNIHFTYDIKATKQPLLDELRFSRVLSNILENAIEALASINRGQPGSISFKTKETRFNGQDSLELVIGNDGPSFNESDIPNLFESTFTKNKKKGTGLGLASSYKIVTLHNGMIRASNRPENQGVDFSIFLPISDVYDDADTYSERLPANIYDALNGTAEGDAHGPTLDSQIKNLGKGHEKIKLLLLEDELLYRDAVKNLVSGNPILGDRIIFFEARTVEEALSLVKKEGISHAIVDIDLGQEKNGFDFLKAMQKDNISITSMVHSNRYLIEDRELAYANGAGCFVPKPLDLANLITFLSEKNENTIIAPELTPDVGRCHYDAVHIEDDHYIRMDWQEAAKKSHIRLLSLSSPSEFRGCEFNNDAPKVHKNTSFYIDRELGKTVMKGEVFGKELFDQGYSNIFIATEFKAEELPKWPWIKKVIGKDPPWMG